jgi:ankyrin repeat protein
LDSDIWSDNSEEPIYFERQLWETPAPLYYASMSGQTEIVELLLSKGVNINAQEGFYGNAL